MKSVLKFLGMMGIIFSFLIHHEIAKLFIWDEEKRLKFYLRSISRYTKMALWVLDIDVSFPKGQQEIKGKLLVSNHVSYTDALILFAYYPSLFVTSKEIRETFLLGRICYLAGCFFIERRKAKRSQGTVAQEIKDIGSQLSKGFNICFFPEGTSSNGMSVLGFKSVFFQTAIDCQKPIQPLCLRYTHVSGEKFSSSNADYVCWYGDMTFPDHLFKLCQQKGVKAQVVELPVIAWDQAPDRQGLALLAQTAITESYVEALNR
jgi:1-acyl-sn-glycerol-3-phosphate acyltransferase